MTPDVLPELLAARSQMAFTLGFHIVLACLGVGLPTMVLIANAIGLRRGDPAALLLARRWSTVMAVTFAVGAVTGTVLSFEMGLLWPGLMGRFGGAFGIPFAIEGLFFFLEAIFIAIYIYGWRRLSPRAHLLSGIPVALSGIGGTFSVVAANAWMNQPAGFSLGPDGRVAAVAPLEVLFNRATVYEVPHMLLAAYMVTGFLLASVYAVGLLRGRADRYVRLGFAVPFVLAAVAAPLQVLVGDVAARGVLEDQPAKFAAMELITVSGPHQPETIGGILVDGRVVGGIQIPEVASLLAGFSPDTVIKGFDAIPVDQRPPASIVHLSWNAMVGIGTALVLLGLWGLVLRWRRRDIATARWFLRAAARLRDRGGRRARGGLDRHRGRPAALGRLPRPADGRCGDPRARRPGDVHRGGRPVQRARGGDARRVAGAPTALGRPGCRRRRTEAHEDDADQGSIPYGPRTSSGGPGR